MNMSRCLNNSLFLDRLSHEFQRQQFCNPTAFSCRELKSRRNDQERKKERLGVTTLFERFFLIALEQKERLIASKLLEFNKYI